jgi:hypothetical protein
MEVEPLKDGWVKYTYEGHRYLFLVHSWGQAAYSVVTRVDWDTDAEGVR